MIETHLQSLRQRTSISEEEERAIRGSVADVRDYATDATVVPAFRDQEASFLLLEGIACRYKDLRNGRRQITALHVPGDFIDLHSFTLKYLDHEVIALTPSRFARVPHERLRHITETMPRLSRIYWFLTNLDATIHREWELSLGRRDARARLAALVCELHVRLGIVGLADDTGYDLGITQLDLAECTGLTNVHVNRTLRELREEGLMSFRSGRVTLYDIDGLRRIAEFDPRYLYVEPRER